MSRQERRRLERQQAKSNAIFTVVQHPFKPNLFQTVSVVGQGEDNEGKKYIASVNGKKFNVKVTPEDFNNGEITVYADKDIIDNHIDSINTLITVFKQAKLTGDGMSVDQLQDYLSDPNKKLLHYDCV